MESKTAGEKTTCMPLQGQLQCLRVSMMFVIILSLSDCLGQMFSHMSNKDFDLHLKTKRAVLKNIGGFMADNR